MTGDSRQVIDAMVSSELRRLRLLPTEQGGGGRELVSIWQGVLQTGGGGYLLAVESRLIEAACVFFSTSSEW